MTAVIDIQERRETDEMSRNVRKRTLVHVSPMKTKSACACAV